MTSTKTCDEIIALLKTELGDIEVTLFPRKAPISVSSFMTHVDGGHFDGASFYRTSRPDNEFLPDSPANLIQGGMGFHGDQSPLPPIAHESDEDTGLKPLKGTIAFARDEPGTACSEFIFNMTDNLNLCVGGARASDGKGIAVFGRISKGMETAIAIQNADTGTNDEQYPDFVRPQIISKPVKILKVIRVK